MSVKGVKLTFARPVREPGSLDTEYKEENQEISSSPMKKESKVDQTDSSEKFDSTKTAPDLVSIGNTPSSTEFFMDVQEKEAIENMLSIANEGVVIERTQDNTTGVPTEGSDPSSEDPTQGSSQDPQVSIDPAPSPHFDAEPLSVIVSEMRSDSEEVVWESEKDSDDMPIANLTRHRPMVAQESTPKRPSTRLQRKEALESTLKNIQAKSRRRKLVKDGKFVSEKTVPVMYVNDEIEEEPGSLTRKRSQKHGLPNPKRGSSVSAESLNKFDDAVASENVVKESGDKFVEESAARVMEELGEKSVKSDEKEKNVCKSAKRKADTDEEPGSSKKARVGNPRSAGKERLRSQKVLWGRTFAHDILEEAGMRQLVEICEF
ncbi:uncharacterized protein [Nicotiana tomentosiformis]|uniref:uncharacterized protein n=1 Tax=Nicotiana tomentosiformis TaxID=4098 RepID=UPI00388C68F5